MKYSYFGALFFCILAIIAIFVNIFIPPTFIMALAPWLLLILAYLSAILGQLSALVAHFNVEDDD